ncbi:hypothetical protein [Streptomyces sp. RerS4]|uniref:hypothetical protein n=1 Tax=Streptomyces sp. RerS4 TaxID=2942449 RepID=UPI00201C73C1|nr:hypothetical protein [Streptomyces sp. RerS4]UQX04636.1 hypothetical protein M4D82_32090 [Streptomyces sp. RerS4]
MLVSHVPGRTWTVRLTGYPDYTVSVTCGTAACRMPPRSKDAASMRRFAAEHVKAHGRLAGARPNAACSCGSGVCSLEFPTPVLIRITTDGVGANDTANGGAGSDTCTTDPGDIGISCP